MVIGTTTVENSNLFKTDEVVEDTEEVINKLDEEKEKDSEDEEKNDWT